MKPISFINMPCFKLCYQAASLTVLFFIAVNAFALSTDSEQPLQLSADSANIQDKKGISTYRGNVILVQGSIQLNADKLVLYHTAERDLEKMIATGSPVRFKQRPDGQSRDINASAMKMTYDVSTQTIDMQQQAVLWQENDAFRGESIRYDLQNDAVIADSKRNQDGTVDKTGRVHVIIAPRK